MCSKGMDAPIFSTFATKFQTDKPTYKRALVGYFLCYFLPKNTQQDTPSTSIKIHTGKARTNSRTLKDQTDGFQGLLQKIYGTYTNFLNHKKQQTTPF